MPRRKHPVSRQRARDHLSRYRAVSTSACDYVFDPSGFYEGLADRLIDNLPLRRRIRRGHWLYEQLNDFAEMLDPDTYAQQAQESVADGLEEMGMPTIMAEVLGAGAGNGLKVALGRTPIGDLSKALRVLISLTDLKLVVRAADAAGPPSPLKPCTPEPATTRSAPASVTS